MTSVMQTIMTCGNGNCFQSCMASILDLPLQQVPHVFDRCEPKAIWTQQQWDIIREFAGRRGYRTCWIDPDTEPDLVVHLIESGLDYIAIGPSWGGDYGHCVVMNRGEFVHDPAGGRFLAGKPWLYVVFDDRPIHATAEFASEYEPV